MPGPSPVSSQPSARRDSVLWRGGRRLASGMIARPALRSAIGRWPTSAEVAAFRRGFERFGQLPISPLLRGFSRVPAARPFLTRAMLASWLVADPHYRGMLKDGLDGQDTDGPGDALSLWTGPRVGFLHLEKTAGSAVTQVLELLFHPAQISPFLADAHRVDADALRRAAFVRSHCDLPELRRIDPERFIVTFLREPRARILSLYHYWRSHTAEGQVAPGVHPGAALANRLGLLELLRDPSPAIRDAIDNFYVRRLTGIHDRGPEGDRLARDPDGALADALAALDGIEFVGVTERMDESMAALGRALEFVPPARSPRVNGTADNAAELGVLFRAVEREAITPEIEAELARLTRLDRTVYAAALARMAGPPAADARHGPATTAPPDRCAA